MPDFYSKKKICTELELDPANHRLYRCDWLEEPIDVITKEERLLKDSGIKQGDVMILRDKDNVTNKFSPIR